MQRPLSTCSSPADKGDWSDDRRILADGHKHGWTEEVFSQHEHFTNSIARRLANGRKEAQAEWCHSMCNMGAATRWLRDGLDVPATICADPFTPTERGEKIREDWLPRWTQPADEANRIHGISQQETGWRGASACR